MSTIKFKTITDEATLGVFLDKFENFTGVRLPLDYAKKSKVVGVFLHDKLSAGYMLVTKPKFRSVAFIPQEIRASNKFFENDEYEMMEVNGLWIGPSLRTPKDQFRVWLKLVLDIFMSKKNYLLLMCDARNENIRQLHSLTKPKFLYEGEPFIMAGEKSAANIRVSYTTRWKTISGIPSYLSQFRSRERRSAASQNRRQLARG